MVGSLTWMLRQSPVVLVNAQADAWANIQIHPFQGQWFKPEISTGHQQPTRMGIGIRAKYKPWGRSGQSPAVLVV